MNNGLGKLRNYAFWCLDSIKGNSVRKHYKEIKFINENYNSEEGKKRRSESLKKILQHAKFATPYYKGIDVELLTQFPVVNKNIIRDNFEQFQSEGYKDKLNYEVLTSGSTGTPFKTFQDKNKKIRNTADTIYFAEKSGFKLGDQLIYIRLWGEQHKKSSFSSWIQNIVTHNVVDLSDADIAELINKIQNSASNQGLLAYASAYDAICQYLDKHNSGPIKNNIKSIIAIAEGLSDYAKESTKKYFGFSAISRYSNIENGIIAQQSVENDNFSINWASYIIEILNVDNDMPIEFGKTGRIVVTDLYNYAVPMIRYDTGDLGAMILVENNTVPVLIKVEGRKMDMLYNTKGELIASHIVHLICMHEGIKQYQLIQEDKKNYLFKINTTSDFNKKNEKKIYKTYKEFLGQDAIINIEYVDDIPLLSSGKRKKVVNLYKMV